MSLSPGLELNRYNLVDTANGARHKVSRKAYHALDLLRFPISSELWMESGAVQKLRKKQAIRLLIQVDQLSGLTVRRKVKAAILVRLKRLLLTVRGVPLAHNVDRQSARTLNLARLVLKSSRVTLLSLLPLGILLYGANMPMKSFMITQCIFLTAILLTTFAHELTHWLLLGDDRKDAVFVRRGLRLAVLHKKQSRSSEVRSAVMGPAAGLCCGVLGAALIAALGGEMQLALTSVAAGSFHVASWLPAYGDGKTLLSGLVQKHA